MATGEPASFLTLQAGTPVFANDDTMIGTVTRVLADSDTAIFDGIVVRVDGVQRFVDAPEVARIGTKGVALRIDADAARRLPEPAANPAVVNVDPRTFTKRTGGLVQRLRSWGRRSGRS